MVHGYLARSEGMEYMYIDGFINHSIENSALISESFDSMMMMSTKQRNWSISNSNGLFNISISVHEK